MDSDMSESVWRLVLGCCALSLGVNASECCPKPSSSRYLLVQGLAPERVSFSYTDGKGLGYTEGYSSLDLFLSQPLCQKRLVPFADLRGHVFNSGRFAANAGLGVRWLDESHKRIWGFNAFYDYLQTSKQPYNQVSFGLEALGNAWDVRLNGYLPVGQKRTNLYELEYENLSQTGFLLKGKEQFAMNGLDSEVGYHLCRMKYFDFYIGVGPYYYWGHSAETKNALRHAHKHALGGRLSASVAFLNYLSLDGVATYDSLFKWGGQATLSLILPFDLTFRVGNSKKNPGCNENFCCLKKGLYHPVLRNEIVVVDRIHRYSTDPDILNPENKP
jgi:hypothetical protein